MNITPLLSYNALNNGRTTGPFVVVSFIIGAPVVGPVILDMLFVWATAKETLPVEAIGKAIKAAAVNIETAIVVVGIALQAVLYIDMLYSWKHITMGTNSICGSQRWYLSLTL
jgi:hypothetical protein